MLDPNYPLYSCRNMVNQIKHFHIWLHGLNNLVVLVRFLTLLIVHICVDVIFYKRLTTYAII